MPGEVIPLGARLRQRREELGMSQAQVARELDVARTAYRLWEMEAARPSPDRWRLVAKWLGLSVTAMLLADELIDETDALHAGAAAGAAGLSGEGWDDQGAPSDGDFFSQERSTIAHPADLGNISSDVAAGLRLVLDRVQDVTANNGPHAWHPGHFRKRFPCNVHAPALARAALAATAVGIPGAALDDATLLVSELVTNSVRHSKSSWVDVDIDLDATRLRIQVSDQGLQAIRPRTPGPDGGFGLALVGELATRWGVERRDTGKTVWIERDLQALRPA
jgi:transcriptional regulator with XRE-family HTH domain/anti-sigma regulatory factor (Ser/Thr protein kinase)